MNITPETPTKICSINTLQKMDKFTTINGSGNICQVHHRGRLWLTYTDLTTGNIYRHYYHAPKFQVKKFIV